MKRILTLKRKRLIVEFRRKWLREKDECSLKKIEFKMALTERLKNEDKVIVYADVCRWVKTHSWITVCFRMRF